MMLIQLQERCYCEDVDYPMAVVGTAGRLFLIYSVENKPTQYSIAVAYVDGGTRTKTTSSPKLCWLASSMVSATKSIRHRNHTM